MTSKQRGWLDEIKQMYLRRRYGQPIYVVSGLPRSGTSMMMKMLAAGGIEVWSDRVREADIDNPEGYFELERIKNLEKDPKKAWLYEARSKVVKIISHLLGELPPVHLYRVILMQRSLDEVIASQNKMLERLGKQGDRGDEELVRQTFETHLWRTQNWMKRQKHFDFLSVEYAEVIEDPEASARLIRDFLELDLDLQEMAQAVNPSLYRNRLRPD